MNIDKILLSRYKIVKKLGKGGFGDTYLAQDTALPGQPYCVVKHLSPKNPNPSIFPIAKKLFDREAQLLYRLGEHNQIPRLYAHFCEEGQFYLVQKYIEGHDLSKEIRPGTKLSEEQTIKLVQEILEVLAAIHRQNVIHRDLKPSNIMRRKFDRKLVLIDFGSVKDLSISMNSAGQKTVGVGSQGYMPPEQSNGHPQLASDIFAVGIIAIQVLTGLRPEQISKDPQTQQLLWRSHAKVSDKFANYIDKMVRSTFTERYQNASEALAALINNVGIPDIPSSSSIEGKGTDRGLKLTKPVKYSLAALTVLIGGILVAISIGVVQNNFAFSRLESYLAAEEWEKADLETDRIMLNKVGDLERLDRDSIEDFNCKTLETIDNSWLKHSDGRFGFSVQKQIYLDKGLSLDDYDSPPAAPVETLFQERVSEIIENIGAEPPIPRGYFPTLSTASPQEPELHSHSLTHWLVLVRVKQCML